MNIELLQPEQADLLNDFVAAHPHGSIEQTWEWGVLQTTIPGRDAMFALGVFDGKKLVGSMLLIRQSMGKGKTWLWAPRGPLLLKKFAKEAWALMGAECRKLAEQGGDVFMRIEPGVPADEAWAVKGLPVKTSYMPQRTLVLDLTKRLEDIQKQMKQKGRYNIKQATKTGVYVKKAEDDQLDDFYDILVTTAERDGFHLHEKQFYSQMMDLLGDKVELYLAYHDHDVLGGLMATRFSNTVTYYFGASSDAHRQKMAPYLMQWFAIQSAKSDGFERYDFLGIAPEGDSKHVLAGVTQFKTRFGGERVDYHKPQVFVYRRLWWWLYCVVKMFR